MLLNVNVNISLGVISAIFLIWIIKYAYKLCHFPPGPWGLPLVGYTPWIGKHLAKTLYLLGKQHGGFYSINLGGKIYIVLNDWPTIKATLVDQAKHFSGRPPNPAADSVTGRKDVISSDGLVCLQQRKLMIKCMRTIGLGRKLMENSIMEEVYKLIEIFDDHHEKNLEMTNLFMKPIQQILWKLISNQSITDEQIDSFSTTLDHLSKLFVPNSPVNIMPWLKYVPPNGFGYKTVIDANNRIVDHLKTNLTHHQLNRNKSTMRDFIDSYLDEIEAKMQTNCQIDPPYNIDHLLGSAWDVFVAGTETSNATCMWGFLLLAHYQDVQQKIQNEIDITIGRNRLPTLDDMVLLTYLQATILEIYRYGAVGPLLVPHLITSDLQMYGYKLTKNTPVIQNIYAVHFDPELWEKPHQFYPERFLDYNNSIKRPPYLMPFSIGPRMCIGESMFEMEFRLILSCLLQKFTISFSKDKPVPSLEPDIGVVNKPFPFTLYIKKRNES